MCQEIPSHIVQTCSVENMKLCFQKMFGMKHKRLKAFGGVDNLLKLPLTLCSPTRQSTTDFTPRKVAKICFSIPQPTLDTICFHISTPSCTKQWWIQIPSANLTIFIFHHVLHLCYIQL